MTPRGERGARDDVDASHHVFIGLIALAVVGFVAVLLGPRRTEELRFDQ